MEFDPFSNKPDISASSRKLYTFNLTKLNGGKPIKDLKFLGGADILEKLEALKPNTRRTYLIAIISALKDRPEAKYKKLYTKFYEPLMALNKDLKDNTKKTEKVKDNWIDQSKIMEIQEDLARIIPEIKDKKKISADEYERLLHLVILSLYTLQQPRRNKDYVEMMIARKVPDDKSKNYLDVADWKWIFNNYKTEKTYKQKVADVPEALKSILEVYMKFHPEAKAIKKKTFDPVPFLVHHDGKVVTSSTDMTRLLNKILGKKVGVSMLRAVYLTDKYGDTLKELKADTSAMGTSVETAQNNYIKEE